MEPQTPLLDPTRPAPEPRLLEANEAIHTASGRPDLYDLRASLEAMVRVGKAALAEGRML